MVPAEENAAAVGCTSSLKANTTLCLPFVDILTFAFEHLESIDPKQAIYADASNPDFCVLAEDVRPKVERLAAGLIARGLKHGDCVCIHSFNSVLYPLLWLAVIAAGGIVTGSNPAYTSSELKHHFEITNTKYVLVQADLLETVINAVSESDVSADNIVVLGNERVSVNKDLTALNGPWNKESRANRWAFNTEHIQNVTIAVHAATSGTTGLPKAAEISHKYLVTQVAIIEHVFSKRAGQIRQLVCLPIFHAFAAQLAVILPLRLGITTYFMPRFNYEPYLDHVQRLQITDVAVVPPIISALNCAPSSALQSLRYVLCAGAPMTVAVQTKLSSKLDPSATVAQVWGTTETGWVTAFRHAERDFTGSVGRLVPNTTLKIVDNQGCLITSDYIPGEALIKSASMMSRYRGNMAANLDAFTNDGYYRTGDRAYMQSGKIYINGRIKDIIKVNGWQVSPEEIEQVLLELKGVKDCAVAGYLLINDKTGLEETRPRAYIVRQPNLRLCAATVQDHVASRLVRYKRLTGGVIFTKQIPRMNTGKIQRSKLLELEDDDGDRVNLHRCVNPNTSAQYLLVAVLVPLCFALGLPGLILLGIALGRVMRKNHRA